MAKVVTGHWDDISHAERVLRWERVAVVMDGMSEHEISEHFHMSSWAVKTKCGTVGCAAGQCALDPWFKRRGFGISFYEHAHSKGDYGMKWTGLNPSDFFGYTGYDMVFLANVTTTKTGRDRKPKAQHRIVREILGKYIRELKRQA